ncbi:MAG: hypothetical protein KDD77_18630, partial [Caldilineaceae bacterium]|nr:hypothetical protein [Caldilineaceae bacterium]
MNASIQQHAGVKLSASPRTDTFQKMGGAAALIEAATFLVGMALGFTLLAQQLLSLAYGADFAQGGPLLATLVWAIPVTA